MKLTDAIDKYSKLSMQISTLSAARSECEEIIRSQVEPNTSRSGSLYTVTMKPGNKRFTGYSDPSRIVDVLVEKGMVEKCMKLDRTSINKLIKEGRLPERIKPLRKFLRTNHPLLLRKKILGRRKIFFTHYIYKVGNQI